MLWQRRMHEQGGVASTQDLHALGLTDVDIRMFAGYGLLIRVRRGRYVLSGTDEVVRDAWSCGGRVACLSALRQHGEPARDDGLLHVEVPANAVLRIPARLRERVRVHWARHPSPGDAAIVSAAAARRQALACRSWPRH